MMLGVQRKPFRRSQAKRRRIIPVIKRRAPLYRRLGRAKTDLQVYDAVNLTGGIGTAMVYTDIFHPVTGNGYTDRYGDKVVVWSLQYNFKVIGVEAAAPNYIRVMILYDMQPNGAAPTSPMPLASANVSAFKSPDFSHRFQIIRSWRIECHSGVVANPSSDEPFYEGYIKMNKQLVFQASTGAVTDFSSGAFWLAAISNDNTNKALIQYGFRFGFSS